MPLDPQAASAVAFLQRIQDRCAGRTQPWSLGTAIFHDDYPIKYDFNYLRIEKDDPSWDARAIAREAERLQAPADLKHRKVTAHDGILGARLAPGFRKLGWNVSRIVIMVHRGEIPSGGPVPVREASFDELHSHFVKWDKEDRKSGAEEAKMLADSMRVVEKETDWRLFVGTIEGEVAGWCELFSDQGMGQIENVGTYSRFRGRGVARSVVVRGLEESKATGHNMHFLLADDEDWPKELYTRLGFEPVGYIYEFLRTPSS